MVSAFDQEQECRRRHCQELVQHSLHPGRFEMLGAFPVVC